MAEQKIEFRQIRDFGENLNATLTFIRENFGPLVKSFFAICGIFMITQAIFNGLYQSQSFNLMTQVMKGRTGASPFGTDNLMLKLFFTLLFQLITMVSMQVALGAYIKSYVQHDGLRPGIDEVWNIFKKYFLKVFLYSLPIGLLMIAGLFFCLFPGVYLWVVFVPFPLILMVEDKGFGEAWQRCFELIKENFWESLAIYLVGWLVYILSTYIIGLTVSAVISIAAYLTTDDLGSTIGIATSFMNIFSFCFYIIFFVCISFHYFTLAEKRDGTGMLQRINSIGANSNNVNDTEEQY